MSEVWTKWQGYVINGEYPLQRFLGGSDQSAVFLTEVPGREPAAAAIKLIPAHPTFAELLLTRWRAAADLPHPNLLQLLDGGQFDLGGQPFAYVVMEYADQQLAELLEHRALSEDEAREMLLPVLDALAFLHNRNLVQGQLKPANILVVGDQIRVASDTIRPVSDAFASTNIASVYDPPEVQDGSISTASDIWALGVTLFEALTRTTPLGLENGRAGAALPPEFSTAFREVVSWCLKRRPFDRPKVAELEAKLRGVRSEPAGQDAESVQAQSDEEESLPTAEQLEGVEEFALAEEESAAQELSGASELPESEESLQGAEFELEEEGASGGGEESAQGTEVPHDAEASHSARTLQDVELSRGVEASPGAEPPSGVQTLRGGEFSQGGEQSQSVGASPALEQSAAVSSAVGASRVVEISAAGQTSKAADLARDAEIVVTADSFSLGETPQSAERSPPSTPPKTSPDRTALSTPTAAAAPSLSASVAASEGAASGELYAQFSTADELGVAIPRAAPTVSSGRTSSGAPAAITAGAAAPARGQSPSLRALEGSSATTGRHPALQLPQQSLRPASSADAAPTGGVASAARPSSAAQAPSSTRPAAAGAAPLPRSVTNVGAAPDARAVSGSSTAPVARGVSTPAGAAPVARSASVAGAASDVRSGSAAGATPDARAASAAGGGSGTRATPGAGATPDVRSASPAGVALDARGTSGVGVASGVSATATPGAASGARSATGAGPAPVTRVTLPGASAPAGRTASSGSAAPTTGAMPTARSAAPGGATSVAGGGPSVARGAPAVGTTQAAAEAARSARPAPTGVRTPTMPSTALAASNVLHTAGTASPTQQAKVAPPPPIDISKRVPREGVTAAPTATPQGGGGPVPVVGAVSKTIEFKQPNLDEAPADAVPDFAFEGGSKRPPYVLLLVAVCVLIVGWVVVQALGSSPQPTAVADQPAPAPPPPGPAASEPTTLVREVPKPLVVASAADTTPQRQNTTPRRAETVVPPPAAVAESTGVHEEIPDISPRARRTIHGHVKVTVRLIVNKDGSVFAALVDDPGPSRYFEQVAIDAAKKWTFPAVDAEDSRVELVRFDFSSQGATGQAVAVQ